MIISRANRLNRVKEYYFSAKLQEVRQLAERGFDVINIGIGSPDLAPSQETISTLQQEAAKPQNHAYQPYRGLPELRESISKWYLRYYGVKLDATNEILPLMGSKEGITHISLAFLNPGDEVLVPELGYPAYRSVSEMVGATVREFPMVEGTWEPDFDKLETMDLAKVKIMWINYPNMPTGAPASASLFEKLVAFAKRKRILLCHDNPYSLILNEKKPISILSVPGAKEVAVELNSMSKSHNMAGWRIGWINGATDYLDEIIKIKSNVDSGMFLPIQKAAAKALSNSEGWHKSQNKIYADRKVVAEEILDSLGCEYSKGQTGMFLWAKINDSIESAEKLVDHLLYEYHVFLSPGFIFGEKGERYIRISLCTPEDKLRTVLGRLSKFNLNQVKKAA
ncbi:aminotransferase [Fulvitalea axinellae]|uniref:Aminotransferase n=1 Tax=Fulvitalea axinellae TaxID=1182444 RepID=A0AAU9D9U5_9BACT|nr:aminotransferase [Fulvitalea axinellae]